MDIGKISSHGSVGRTHEQKARPAQDRTAGTESRNAHDGDKAEISTSGLETARKADAFAEAARADDPERAARVAEARARLESGAYNDPAVHEHTAARILGL